MGNDLLLVSRCRCRGANHHGRADASEGHKSIEGLGLSDWRVCGKRCSRGGAVMSKIEMFRSCDPSRYNTYTIIETFETISGPRLRVCGIYSSEERAKKHFDKMVITKNLEKEIFDGS